MEGWRQFCYGPVLSSGVPSSVATPRQFQWWAGGDFDTCFQYLAIVTTSSALFGLLSTLYAGRYNSRYRRRKRPAILVARLLLAVCLALNSLVEFVAGFWLADQRPYAVLTAECVSSVSWAAHVAAVWVFSTSVAYTGRGPLVLNGSWYLTLIASVLHFRSVIRWTHHHAVYHYVSPSEMYFAELLRVTAYAHMGLQILYGLSFLFGVREAGKDGARVLQQQRGWRWRNKVVSIQYEDEYEHQDEVMREKQPLIHSRFSSESSSAYGSVIGSWRGNLNFDLLRMNAYEDRANLLSLFTFWWVWPLLRRGAMGYLESVTDLPQMPKSLQTSCIRDKFRRVLLKRRRHTSAGRTESKNEATTATPTAGVNFESLEVDSEVLLHSFTRSTPVVSAYTTSPESPVTHQAMSSGQSADGPAPSSTATSTSDKQAPRTTTSILFLFSALNRAFGWHYYPLGLLKFATDLLGFSGPLLLYQLVSFIENKQVRKSRNSIWKFTTCT